MIEVPFTNPVMAAIVGAIFGSYGTYKARERSREKEKEERVDMLRSSLLAELGSMDELATIKASNPATQIPAHSLISAEVYRSNSSDISLLTSAEAEAVIRFYSGAIMLQETLRSSRELIAESDHPQMHNFTPVNDNIENIRKLWKECVLALLSEDDEYPSKIKIEDETIPVGEEMSSADLWDILNYERLDLEDSEIEFVS